MNNKILFITYDGLTDSLGQSQILPYMIGLSNNGYQVTILSCEKKFSLNSQRSQIQATVDQNNIRWEFITFTTKPRFFAKVYDLFCLKRKATRLHKINKFSVVHCRSYVAANIGLFLKRKFQIKFIFDMRGFWADERKDSGAWNLKLALYRYLYNMYKSKEQDFILGADAIVTLTYAAEAEIKSWSYCNNKQLFITVIPCCADLQLFSLTSIEQKLKSKIMLGYSAENLVVSYLGSLGTYYLLDEMLQFFAQVKNKYTTAKFLIVTHSDKNLVINKINKYAVALEDVQVLSASRAQVPEFLKASDISLSFIIPAYSKIASSPTKVGEILAMGIPIIANAGIGDMSELAKREVCHLLKEFTLNEYNEAIKSLDRLLKLESNYIRQRVTNEYLFSVIRNNLK